VKIKYILMLRIKVTKVIQSRAASDFLLFFFSLIKTWLLFNV